MLRRPRSRGVLLALLLVVALLAGPALAQASGNQTGGNASNGTNATGGTTNTNATAGATASAPPARPLPWWGVAALLAAMVFLAAVLVRRLDRGIPVPDSPETEMPLTEHLRELQHRLVIILLALGFFLLFFFSFGPGSVTLAGYEVPLPVPTVHDSYSAVVLENFKHQFVPSGVQLVVLAPLDGVLTQVTVTLFLAVITTSPLIAYELGLFLAPGLLEDEKRFILRAVPLVTVLFLLGALFAYVWMVPLTMSVLYGYANGVGALALIHLPELVDFAVVLMLLFGLAFELPVLMAGLSEMGLVPPDVYVHYWRHAVVVIMIVAALVSDPTVVSQLLVGGPLLVLYGVGILAAKWRYRSYEAKTGARSTTTPVDEGRAE